MKDNKENEKEVINNQINENQEESTVTSNNENVTFKEETVVENIEDAVDNKFQEELESTLPLVEEKKNSSKNLSIKEDSKVLFVMGIILVIIGTLLELGMYVYKNIQKNDEQKASISNEEIMKQIGQEVIYYFDENAEFGEPEFTFEEVINHLHSKFNFECELIEIYENGKSYFHKCSINGSEPIYSYGTQLTTNETNKLEPSSSQLYDGYTRMKINMPTKYSPIFDIDEYGNYLEIFALIINPNYDKSDEDDEMFMEIPALFEISNGYVYINILDEKIRIEGIKNAKQVIASDKRIGSSAGEWDIIVLTDDNKVYMLSTEQFIDINCDEDGECTFEESFESKEKLIEKVKKIRMIEVPTNNNYDEIKLAFEGMNIFWLGITSDDKYYAFDMKEKKEVLLSEYIPYAYKGDCNYTFCIDYIVDLNGNVKNDNVDYKIKAKGIFESFRLEENDEECDFILDTNDNLSMICSNKEYNAENILVKDSKVSSIYYKEIINDGDKGYNVIFVFEDNTTLEVIVGAIKTF